MKSWFKIIMLVFSAVSLLSGCSEADERRHPLYIKAMQDRQAGNGKDAAEKLNELLKRRPRSIYTHKLLASVYDEMLNDPASAVYHYKTYLQSMPEASDAEEVKAWLTQAEKRSYEELAIRFGKTAATAEVPENKQVAAPEKEPNTELPAVPESNTANTAEHADKNPPLPTADNASGNREIIAARDAEISELKNKLAQYQVRYNAIRQEVEKLRKLRQKPVAVTVPEPANSAVSTGGYRQYKVVAGDTPGGIARKVYGKSSLYYIIMQANPRVDARKLRPGMNLNIPPLPTNKNTVQGNNQ